MIEQIEEALRKLPYTAHEIADYLHAEGITGVKEQGNCCPISRWLKGVLGVERVNVDIEEITVYDGEGLEYTVATPAAVGRFTTIFDLREQAERIHDREMFDRLEDLDGPTEEELAEIQAEWEAAVEMMETIVV